MRNSVFAIIALTSVTACTRGELDAASTDTARNVDLVPSVVVPAYTDGPLSRGPAAGTLAIGSRINATWGKILTSGSNKVGETFTVTVSSDVKDGRGRVVIPRGAVVDLLIKELAPATSRSDADGKLVLGVTSTTFGGNTYSLTGEVTSLPHTLRSQGIGKSEAVKVGIGTAVGAAAGQVIGRDTKAT